MVQVTVMDMKGSSVMDGYRRGACWLRPPRVCSSCCVRMLCQQRVGGASAGRYSGYFQNKTAINLIVIGSYHMVLLV